MKSSHKDFLFIFASLAVFAFFGWALYADLTAVLDKGDGERLGTVVFKKRVAQRKYDDQVIWETITNHSVVYVNDSIRTDEDSEAMLVLDDGTSIELGESTLIMLVRTGRGLGIDFQQGSLSAAGREGQARAAFEITSGDTKLDLAKADAVFRKNAASSELLVDVTRGQAVLERGRDRIAVQENDRISLREGSETEVKQANLIPRGGSGLVIVDTKPAPHTFSWSAIGIDEVIFDIARSASFARDVQSSTTRNQDITLELEEGTWFWRLRASDGSLSRTERTMLVLIKEAVPLVPADGAQFTFFKKLPLISLQWSGDEAASVYAVELARDPNFRNVVRALQSRVTSVSIDDLAEGMYWWRVTPRYSSVPRELQPGPAASFTIERLESPPAVEVPPLSTISTLQLEAHQVAVTWKGNPEYAMYRLELADSPDFSIPLYTEETRANYSRFRNDIPEDKYYLRIAAIDEQGNVLARSSVSAVDVRSPRPVILMTPEANASLVSDGEGLPITFAWNEPNRTGRVRFELANDESFYSLQRNLIMNGNSQNMTLIPGEYFWRVTVLNERGVPVAEPSMRRFDISAVLASPVLRIPVSGERIDMETANAIDFAWEPVERANAYRFSLYMYQGNAVQTVFESPYVNTTTYRFTLLNHLNRGTFAWEVRAFLRENGRDRTTSKPSLRRDFIIHLPELRRPAIVLPQVIYAE